MMESKQEVAELFREAGEKYFAGRWAESRDLLEQIIKLEPTHILAYRNLGIIHRQLGHAQETIDNLSKAQSLGDSLTTDIARMLGDSYFMVGNYEKGITFLKEAITLDEENTTARYWLALCFIQMAKKTDDAIYKICAQEQASELNSKFPHLAKEINSMCL